MRKLDFDNKTNWELLDMKNLVQDLLIKNYSADRIRSLLGLTKHQMKLLIHYKFYEGNINFKEKENDITEDEMLLGTPSFSYEELSTSEKLIYDNLR
jgi:hypothetical protein